MILLRWTWYTNCVSRNYTLKQFLAFLSFIPKIEHLPPDSMPPNPTKFHKLLTSEVQLRIPVPNTIHSSLGYDSNAQKLKNSLEPKHFRSIPLTLYKKTAKISTLRYHETLVNFSNLFLKVIQSYSQKTYESENRIFFDSGAPIYLYLHFLYREEHTCPEPIELLCIGDEAIISKLEDYGRIER
jgi:hypothetical protein